jgi:hypothetical protein
VAEYVTKRISEEIKFYDKVKPYKMFKNQVFSSGCGIGEEHIINIKINLDNEGLIFNDSFEWDLLNEKNR